MRDIQLSRQAITDASGSPSGSIHLQGRTIRINDGSVVLLVNQGSQASGNIVIHASELLESKGIGTYGFVQNFIRTDRVSSGAGGNLIVSAPQLWLQDGARITTRTYGSSDGGKISVDVTHSAQLIGYTPLDL